MFSLIPSDANDPQGLMRRYEPNKQTYMLRQNGKRLYKGLYVTFKLAPDLKKNTVYSTSYSPLNEGHVSILTNSKLRTYISNIDEHIILR